MDDSLYSPMSLKYFLVLTFFLLYSDTNIIAEAQNDPSIGYAEERAALLALRSALNNPFINGNWTHLHCFLNNSPTWYGVQCSSNGRVTGIVLEDLELTGRIDIEAFYNLTELSVLSFRSNFLAGNVMDFSRNPKMTNIDLSGNVFYGHIHVSLLDLEFLRSLQLQSNLLTGPLPGFEQESLKVFNVSNNYLEGTIPKTRTLQSFGSDSYSSNSKLCGPPSSSCSSSSNDTSEEPEKGSSNLSISHNLFVIIDAVGFVVVLLLFVLYFIKVRKLKQSLKKQERNNEIVEVDEVKEIKEDQSNKIIEAAEASKGKLVFAGEGGGFELNELLKASAEGLGKGNFGNCYKAKLQNRAPVVVKRLRNLKPVSSEELMKQLQVVGGHKHPNLLPLLAYFYSKEEMLLVYKFAEKGSLFNRIHGMRGTIDRIPFNWNSRLMVARGVARALEYLHTHTHEHHNLAPHGNLKPSNVLLDENDTVLVSDYGLNLVLSAPIAAQRMVSYKSPEYQNGKKLSEKSDTWSYGCLLLELLTARVSVHSAPAGVAGVDLCSWVHNAVREEWTAEIFDFELFSLRTASRSMLRLLQIAIRCCDKSPEKRPEMTEVVREVENIKVDDSEDDDDSSKDRSDDSASTIASGDRRR